MRRLLKWTEESARNQQQGYRLGIGDSIRVVQTAYPEAMTWEQHELVERIVDQLRTLSLSTFTE
jgi:hypothetical protein